MSRLRDSRSAAPAPAFAATPVAAAAVSAAAQQHAAAAAPEESIGLVVGGRYEPQANIADNPREHARVDPDALLEAQRAGLQAVIHSHPHPAPPCPSLQDMRAQLACAVPWAIVPVGEDRSTGELVWWGPGVPIPPLIGRGYRHGVTDCYSIVRDWYRLERGIELADVPRGWRWWGRDDHPDLYETGYRELGFETIPRAEAGVGDWLLMQLGAQCVNHGAVLVEPGVILHHPGGDRPYDPTRLSRRDVAARWFGYVRRVVRYTT